MSRKAFIPSVGIQPACEKVGAGQPHVGKPRTVCSSAYGNNHRFNPQRPHSQTGQFDDVIDGFDLFTHIEIQVFDNRFHRSGTIFLNSENHPPLKISPCDVKDCPVMVTGSGIPFWSIPPNPPSASGGKILHALPCVSGRSFIGNKTLNPCRSG